MGEKSAEDRSHEVRMALLGFFLTTVAGTIITFAFQWFEERQKQYALNETAKIQLVEQRRTSATALFDDLSPLIDERLYLWRQVAWALEEGATTTEIVASRNAYRTTLNKWNFRLNRNRALLCRFFGPTASNMFEEQIMPGFRKLHQELTKAIRAYSSTSHKKPKNLSEQADSLNHIIHVFNGLLAEAIRSGEVGRTDPDQACQIEDEERTTGR